MTQAWMDAIVRASWHGALLAVGVWLLLAVFRRLSPSIRCSLWLLAAFKFLLVLLVVIELPVLSSPPPPLLPQSSAPALIERTDSAFGWEGPLFAGWLIGLALVSLRALVATQRVHRLVKGTTAAGGRITAMWDDIRSVPGVEVRIHPAAAVPMVAGLFRPVVVLPEQLVHSLEDDELRMILAHEDAHLRRKDVLASVPMFLCCALFYFHPLVWLIRREWQHDREAACDAAALKRLGVDIGPYARMLLKVSSNRNSAPGWAMSAAPSFHTLHRRIIDMKDSSKQTRGNALSSLLIVLTAAAAIPLVLVHEATHITATSRPVHRPALPALKENESSPKFSSEKRNPDSTNRKEAATKTGRRSSSKLVSSHRKSEVQAKAGSEVLKGSEGGWSEASNILAEGPGAAAARKVMDSSGAPSFSAAKGILSPQVEPREGERSGR